LEQKFVILKFYENIVKHTPQAVQILPLKQDFVCSLETIWNIICNFSKKPKELYHSEIM